jgi:integrase
VKDVDFERREITVRRGKGQKDRRVMLPESRAPAAIRVFAVNAGRRNLLAACYPFGCRAIQTMHACDVS